MTHIGAPALLRERGAEVAGVLGVPLAVSPVPVLRQLAQVGVVGVTCFDPGSLLSMVGLNGVSLVMVDGQFGGRDTSDLIRAVRDRTHGPIFLLDHRCGEEVSGGAEVDAVFRTDVPLAPQIQSWLPLRPPSGGLRWGPLLLDRRTRRASWNGRELPLTPQQFRLLARLAEEAGGLVAVDELSDTVYEGHVGADRKRLMAHIRRVRRLLEPDPTHPAVPAHGAG